MTATEDDEELALRGYLIGRTGCLPTEQAFQELSRNETLLRYTVYWLQRRDEDILESISKLLGTHWTREEVARMAGNENAAAPDEVFLPLALAANQQLAEQLREMFRIGKGPFIGGGEYVAQPGEQVVEMGELSIDEFKRMAQMAGSASVPSPTPTETPVTSKQEHDPRIQRMREQIAHSKRVR